MYKHKILMIYPKTDLDKKKKSIGLPLSILHTISYLKEIESFIIDQRVDKDWDDTLMNLLKEHKFICIGISTMTGSQIGWGLKSAKIIRELSPNTPIIFGGIHPTIYPEQTIKHPLVDIIVIGDGESTFPKLINALKNKKSLDKIKGLSYIKNGKVINTGQAEPVDLNDYPEPDYSLINIQDYFLNLYYTKNALSLVTGRGCSFRCAFCYNSILNRGKWRALSIKNIIKRIKTLIELGAESIHIIDDNFFTDINRVKEICKEIKKENIKVKFVVNCRADYVTRFSEEFLQVLYDSGFDEFYVGIESGSQKILDYIKKDITLEQVYICNKKLKKIGINPIYSFMAGFPNETFKDIQETINLMMRLLKENPSISLTSLKVYTPFPGSKLFNECVKHGLKVPKSFEEWNEFTYNSSSYEWRTKKENKLLKKLSYITYFLDQKTMIKHFNTNLILKLLVKVYSKYIWCRCKLGVYFFLPEVYIMEKLRRMIS